MKKMETNLETIIKNRLQTWEAARKKKDEFIGHRLTGESFTGRDIFEMALAFDNEKRAWIDYELAEAAAYPEGYTNERLKHLLDENDRLTKRIRAWKNKQFPGSRS